MPNPEQAGVSVLGVDDSGIVLAGAEDLVVDVSFDGRRIWSFWTVRDTEPGDGDRLLARWPGRLRRFLHGTTRVTVSAHVTEEVLFDEEVTLGRGGDQRIEVVNAQGQPLGMDKSGRLQLTFETRSARDVAPLLDAIEDVLGALHRAGVEAFPAYGTLLGAVREGRLLGHDSDADLGYVSRRTVPVDVIRESYDLQRRLARMGYRIRRYSGAGFAVLVEEADGSTRGLDVFGGFLTGGHLVLLGEVRVPFREEWIFPLGTTVLEGRTLPAPAEPDRLLTATYGPSWRVPDPAFVFETPASTSRRLDDWFRGIVEGRAQWDGRYQAKLSHDVDIDTGPNKLAKVVLRRETGSGPSRPHGDPERPGPPRGPGVVVDVGCGHGHNAYWLARRGVRAEGLDFSYRAFAQLRARAAQEGLPVRYGVLNLLETRHVLGHGARLARLPGPRVVLARHVADTLPSRGRDNLWRLASMVCRGGGRTYLDFLTGAAAGDPWVERQQLTPLEPDQVEADLAHVGGTVVHREEIRVGPRLDNDDSSYAPHRQGCRMVVAWQT